MKLRRIEISFPELVEVKDDEQQYINEMLAFVCKRWTRENPGRLMWIAGVGCKILYMPMMAGDERPMQFADDVLAFDAFEREDYDWLCSYCGKKQGDHHSCGGDIVCTFEPAPAKARKYPTLYRRIRRKVLRVWDALMS